jgi:membrane protease YdiL (CAAX protease family)
MAASGKSWRAADLAGPIAMGLAILVVGVGSWLVLYPLNVRHAPEAPWAAGATLAFLVLFLAWLGGAGPPRRSRAWRSDSLRLRLVPRARIVAEGPAIGALLLVFAFIYIAWTVMSIAAAPPDLGDYPTTALRFSALIMGALISGVVEEAAFRGYMQANLERFGPAFAIGVTSLVFTLSHGVHGPEALLVLGPGLFLASVLYGLLAYKTGSILPGAVIHVAGDFSRVFFGVMGGDPTLLFAG